MARTHGLAAARANRTWRIIEVLACAALCLASATASRAHAQPARGAGPDREAAVHFDRGVELYGEGNLDAALVEFERAYQLVPTYRVLFNLAQIQAERHEYVAALGLFERYLSEGGAEVTPARKSEALEEIARLRGRIAELSVAADVPGAQLFVNGELVGALPRSAPVLINPGLVHVRVEKPGYRAITRELKVTGGDKPRLELKLGPPLTSADVPAQAAEESNYRPLWIASATALALGGATLTFGLLAQNANRELDRELDRFPAQEGSLHDERAKVKTYAALTDGFGAATLVAFGVAVYFLIDPPRSREASGPATLTSTLRLVPKRDGLALFGRF